MRNWQGRRVTLRERVLRLLGVVSPSGAYPLPPRWAMSKLGRSRYYNPDGSARTRVGLTDWTDGGNVWDDIAGGPLPVRDPGTHFVLPPVMRSASVCQPRSGCTCGSQPSGCAASQNGGEGSC